MDNKSFFGLYILIFGVLTKSTSGKSSSARNKRFLLTPAETQYGAFITVSVPLQPDTTVSMAWFFEANYYTTAEAKYFHPLVGIEPETSFRKTRDVEIEKSKEMITRSLMYTFLESMFERPSTSKSEENIEDEFYIAEHLGTIDECFHYEHECPKSPFDLISLFTE